MSQVHSPGLMLMCSDHVFNVPHSVVYSLLIPPIIFHASLDLYSHHFTDQFWSILTLALPGTALSTLLIAGGLLSLYTLLDPQLTIFPILAFSSAMAAVDPVAVLAVFEDINADKSLHFLIFGEALLNDGVAFVLFEGSKELAAVPPQDVGLIPWSSYLSVSASLITSSLGGLLCGLVSGVMSAVVTRFTSDSTRHLEILVTVVSVVLGYLLSTKLGWSGILSLISAGLSVKRYCFPNLHHNSIVALLSGAKCLALISEVIIFVLLGNSITKRLTWHWQFMITSAFLCLLSRAVTVLFLCWLLNWFREVKISYKFQLVMWMGGLRGAVAYTLIISYSGPYSDVFVDTSLFIIFLTVIVKGVLVGPVVRLLDLTDGGGGGSQHVLRYWSWEERFVIPLLQRRVSPQVSVRLSSNSVHSGKGDSG